VIMFVGIFFLCLPTGAIENFTKVWNANDQLAFERATMRCKQVYPDYPCLKKFIKLDEHRYMVKCGKND